MMTLSSRQVQVPYLPSANERVAEPQCDHERLLGGLTRSEEALALRYGRPVIVRGWHDTPAGAAAAETLLAFVRARLG